MITFTISLIALIIGYFIYGKFVERIFGPDNRKTPAITMQDGVDYVPLPAWRVFMIQFLNIAGLGPIFGAILGAKFGEASFLWIVFGCIFAGATHDYVSGMLSMRHGGESLHEVVGRYLGPTTKKVALVFTMILMVLLGAVFVAGPAQLLAKLIPQIPNELFWVVVIFIYYIIATMLPIDKIIGKIYPIFAISLIFMALGLMAYLFIAWPSLPEVWTGLQNTHPEPDSYPIFPMMFISISCGAVSGFHATQSPLMARCIKSERLGRPIFFGAMITEGIVALVWAAAATFFYHNTADGMGVSNAAEVVFSVTHSWLGPVGGLLAVLGVIAAPITSGDTAFRSARLIVADALKLKQRKIATRLKISVPLFLVALCLLIFNLSDPDGFGIIWRYFAWFNQTLATFTLWTVTMYFVYKHKCYWIGLIPALFMTAVTVSYILIAPEGFSLPHALSYCIAGIVVLLASFLFCRKKKQIDNGLTL